LHALTPAVCTYQDKVPSLGVLIADMQLHTRQRGNEDGEGGVPCVCAGDVRCGGAPGADQGADAVIIASEEIIESVSTMGRFAEVWPIRIMKGWGGCRWRVYLG